MAYTNRGGPPFTRRLSVTTGGVLGIDGVAASVQAAGRPFNLPSPTSWLRLVAGTNVVQVYFNQADYDADRHFLTVTTTVPVELPAELTALWAKSLAGNATLEVLGISKV